ncbi:MAG: hypothetical protein COZ06_06115 [Armatimonadetes bacterium CG_4_10_14_3_um_filter_66_18]|nr:hypothetical protein [Armatimonadota bacterium]OIP00081.1 MAG: hypothetical protein AUJ96_18840 [Armatimonadetes bacterium CG2_30_66_41]PIU94755.1 MAG: hypothetical protein COS65_06005 [Armatimonadetes bacterium CG06_land_8_20_14_3_00_66_21]PIX41850.1 MAG: hypothetical protein COZ57_22525 [Armatimonadetes bacterium CG_4_8_14_3_um_filter_66_20]PIY51070.1 MAG: hypothetical protein COZ06_06115 [Armatimonadetes bacterium CG_4_10_14_3_um_filter_66_18]PIZ39151.1 MAG: hypothetical protein COY42_22
MMPGTLWSLIAAAVVVSAAHAALPSHWLPFVLMGRSQGWTSRRVVAVAALAGLGHVTLTSALGLLIALAGMGLLTAVGDWGQPVMAGVLLATGAVYLLSAWRGGQGHPHHHHPSGDHNHSSEHPRHGREHDCAPPGQPSQALSDRAAFWSLFAVLTFSPCEGMVPFFFASARFGWFGLLLLAAVTAALTVLGIVALVSLTQAGLERVRLPFGERGERVLTGVVLAALGAATFFWH